jgi:hypothetical protein
MTAAELVARLPSLPSGTSRADGKRISFNSDRPGTIDRHILYALAFADTATPAK